MHSIIYSNERIGYYLLLKCIIINILLVKSFLNIHSKIKLKT